MAQVSLVPSIMKSQFAGFSPDALSFLRALKRNNRREWFQHSSATTGVSGFSREKKNMNR